MQTPANFDMAVACRRRVEREINGRVKLRRQGIYINMRAYQKTRIEHTPVLFMNVLDYLKLILLQFTYNYFYCSQIYLCLLW